MPECQNIEWKEKWSDDYLKWICGFSNAQGGVIHIGRNNKGIVVGLSNIEKLLEDIPNKVRDILGIIVDVNLLEENGKKYMQIVVFSNPYPVSYKGEYYYRSGSTMQQLKGQTLSQFLLKKWDLLGIVSQYKK